jgi:hypothetical protein
VLDFGLAKLVAGDPAGVQASVSQSPTLTAPAVTGVGTLSELFYTETGRGGVK